MFSCHCTQYFAWFSRRIRIKLNLNDANIIIIINQWANTTFNLNQSLTGVKGLGSINYTLQVENVFTEQFLKTKYYQKTFRNWNSYSYSSW